MSSRCCCGARLAPKANRQGLSITSGPKTTTRRLHCSTRRYAGETEETTDRRRSNHVGAQIDNGTTALRRRMFAWLHGPGRKLRQPLNGSTNYLGAYNARGELTRTRDAPAKGSRSAASARDLDTDDPLDQDLGDSGRRRQRDTDKASKGNEGNKLPPETAEDLRPYPLNKHFRSQPVLSESFREEIWRRVTQDGQDIQLISSGMGVSTERVAAVVRLKVIEKQWQSEGKPLATPYSKAVLSMLPNTPFDPQKQLVVHESINDLQVHPQTKTQIFHPASESRHFTREDAGRAFGEELLSADKRVPHPELVLTERDRLSGMSAEEQATRAAERMQAESERRQRIADRRRLKQEKETTVVSAGRWDFMFREINAEAVGKNGRSESAVGWRYGVPHQDRKKGQVKIPTRVL